MMPVVPEFAKLDLVPYSCLIQLTRDCRRHSAAQGSDGSHGDFFTAVLGGAGVSGCDHVWFQQGALQVDMVV